ncbi:MAG: PASTA domain-containing protein [Acidobacteria bacterium]|nr:PASTA domain-containing protein [Acidobacteriota bacterium]
MEQRRPRVRVLVIAVLALFWIAAVLARLSFLQLFHYREYLSRAQRQQQRIVEVSPRRGEIYDRNLRELAMSISVDSCFAVPSEISDPAMASRLLAGVLGNAPEEIEAKLKGSRSFVWVARKLPPDTVERVNALNLKGIYFQKESRRFYPKRELASHVLGYVDVDERGLAGIEQSFDSQVRSKPGKLMILADARRRWYDRSEKAPESGSSVVLTLDEKIQYIAEKELAAAIEQTHAESGIVVVQDPQSGDLLAVANYPTFNPNSPGESSPDSRMNRAVVALYEPGSIFKIVTIAGALEEGLTKPSEIIDCQMGAIFIAGHRIRDHKPFGLLDVSQIMAKSSDVGAIKLGLRLGAPKFYDYIRAFGFGQPTDISLPGESKGLLRRVENWTPVSVGSISMGQEIGVTAVQMVSAFSAIGNGGLLYKPRVAHDLRRNGSLVPMAASPSPQRVISPTTAATLRRMLEGVVLEGTATAGRLDGYTAGGKTGTAQKTDPATGRYSLTKYVASFVGFAPLNSPAITILVSLDSPVGGHHGGDVAAPVFKRIAEQTLAYLDVPHDVVVTPAMQLAAAKRKKSPLADVSDFDPVQRESLASTLPVFPPDAPASGKENSVETVALAEGEGIAVPAFAGRAVRGVTEECVRLGLSPVLIGSGVALDQNPEAGTRVRRGSRITVRFSRSAS